MFVKTEKVRTFVNTCVRIVYVRMHTHSTHTVHTHVTHAYAHGTFLLSPKVGHIFYSYTSYCTYT